MEINKNGHLYFNALAYRQLDPNGETLDPGSGASDTLDPGSGTCDILNQGRRG